jgi:integrase
VKEWKWLAPHQNPMPGVAKLTEPKGRERFLSDGERLRLLDACRKSGYAPLYLMMLLSVTTGMRRGEMLKLTWTDIDLDRRDEQGNPDARATLRNTKNGDTRVAALIPEVVSLLREHGKVRMLGNDLVFCAGGAPEVNDFDEAWYRALKDAKVKNFRWHDLRHTAASYAAMSGATLPELAAMLGHRQMSMVARYSHLTDQHVGKVVTRMAAKFFS